MDCRRSRTRIMRWMSLATSCSSLVLVAFNYASTARGGVTAGCYIRMSGAFPVLPEVVTARVRRNGSCGHFHCARSTALPDSDTDSDTVSGLERNTWSSRLVPCSFCWRHCCLECTRLDGSECGTAHRGRVRSGWLRQHGRRYSLAMAGVSEPGSDWIL